MVNAGRLLRASLLGTFVLASVGLTSFTPEQEATVVLESVLNANDGSTLRGCVERGQVGSGKKHQMWMSFGAVEAADRDWKVLSPRVDCGEGEFDSRGAPLVKSFGTPYLIVDFDASVAPGSTPSRVVATNLRLRKLTGFDPSRRPTYVAHTSTRTLDTTLDVGSIVPLLVASPQEKEAFGISEIFVKLEARKLTPLVAYGAVSVTSDVPGAAIFLDGGMVGRTKEQGPTLLSNVSTGKKTLRVVDLSDRQAETSLLVERGRTATVVLPVLKVSRQGPDLQPIGSNPEGFKEYWRGRDGAVVVTIPAGEFVMGSAAGQGEANERPERHVFLSTYLIDKTEVTWRQFRKFAEATSKSVPPAPLWGAPDDYPVVNVLWDEAQKFCEWVGGALPTEAQWEKAARGTDGAEYSWGKTWDPDRCNSIDGGPHRPQAAGTFMACKTPYGVVDMPGSVWEWNADWYADGYSADPSPKDPTGPSEGRSRVLRGGGWMSQPNWLRTTYRSRNDPAARDVDHGFRCAQRGPGEPTP